MVFFDHNDIPVAKQPGFFIFHNIKFKIGENEINKDLILINFYFNLHYILLSKHHELSES